MPRILGLLFLHMGSAMASPNRDFAARHSDRPVVVAHRGASALAPENTLAAIQLASRLGSAAVEFDVHASADGLPVVIHDATLARTTDGRGLVRKHTLQQLQSLNAGSWFGPEFHSERVPSLAEALQVAGDEMILCIEIKTGAPIMKRVFADVERAGLIDRMVVFSFKPTQIEAAKKLYSYVPALLLVEPGPDRRYDPDAISNKARSVRADLIGLDHTAATGPIVDRLQKLGFPVFVYTVNEPRDVERVVAFGVDGVISNHPRATLSRVHRLRPTSK